jgi:CheY-like chemotaxis protein
MALQKADPSEDAEDEARRLIHDIAAAIIGARALAETLDEHLPTLVAMSRSRLAANKVLIPPDVLDSLPSIPAEIIDLCTIARASLQAIRYEPAAKEVQLKSTDAGPRCASGETDPGLDQSDRKSARVLLVEDEETLRYTLSQRLRAKGCRVTDAANGSEAVGLFDSMRFDLVLMDLRLPGMSGWETTKRLREIESPRGRCTRMVGLTASPLLEDQTLAVAAGMDEVLVKPVDDVALQAILSSLILQKKAETSRASTCAPTR